MDGNHWQTTVQNAQGLNAYLYQFLAAHPPTHRFCAKDAARARVWQRRLTAELQYLLAPWPSPGDLAVRVVEQEDMGSYVRERLFLRTTYTELPLYLFRPKRAGRKPVLICLHGHGSGKGKVEVAGVVPSRTGQGYAPSFAEKGFICICPDFHSFGEREQPDHHRGEGSARCNAAFVTAMLFGVNPLTLNIWDVRSCVDWACSQPDVDAARIGCLGVSYGGTVTLYAAALEPRIRKAVLGCSFGSFLAQTYRDNTCGVQVVPGILQVCDVADVAGLIAPRPLLITAATNDRCFQYEHARPELQRLEQIYATLEAAPALTVATCHDDHRYYPEAIGTWFDDWLS